MKQMRPYSTSSVRQVVLPKEHAHRLRHRGGELEELPGSRWKPCWQKPCWQINAHGLLRYVGASARVAPLREHSYIISGAFLVAQSVHLHQRTSAARAHKSASTVSANMVSRLIPMRNFTLRVTSTNFDFF